MWRVILEQKAQKQFNKLGVNIQNRIAKFIDGKGKLIPSGDPRAMGKPLSGKSFGNYVCFRVGDYRLICDIQDQEITVLVLRIGHRKEVCHG